MLVRAALICSFTLLLASCDEARTQTEPKPPPPVPAVQPQTSAPNEENEPQCVAKACTRPPADECASETTVRRYAGHGSCVDEACSYGYDLFDCEAPEHATARCANAECSFVCDAGYEPKAGGCEEIVAPSLISAIAEQCVVAKGELQCWGTLTGSDTPVRIANLTGTISSVARGSKFACVIEDGEVRCWGDNAFGQLGDGTNIARSVPVTISSLTGATALASSGSHVCALLNGAVLCWGGNSFGRLGNGTNTNSNVPVPVIGLDSNVTAIAASYSHSCAIRDGGLWCWGSNFDGQLANACSADETTSVPLLIPGYEHGVTAVATGDYATIVLKDGRVTAFGNDNWGILGRGGPPSGVGAEDGNVPAAVIGLGADVVAIAAESEGACAIKTDGNAYCWGINTGGLLGTGATTKRLPTPGKVLGLPGKVLRVQPQIRGVCASVGNDVYCVGEGIGLASPKDSATALKIELQP